MTDTKSKRLTIGQNADANPWQSPVYNFKSFDGNAAIQFFYYKGEWDIKIIGKSTPAFNEAIRVLQSGLQTILPSYPEAAGDLD